MPDAPAQSQQLVSLDFPMKGLNAHSSVRQQEPGTSPSLSNVLPYDPTSGRARGGQRPGLVKASATQLAATTAVQALYQVVVGASATTLVDEPWGYAVGELAAVSGGAWTHAAGTSTLHVDGTGTVTANPLTGISGTAVYLRPALFANASSFLATVPLTLQASTGAGDSVEMRAEFQQSGSSIFEVDFIHAHNAGTPQTTVTISLAGDSGSPFSTTVAAANATGTWTVSVAGLDDVNVSTPTVVVQKDGVTFATRTGSSTFYPTVNQLELYVGPSQTAGTATCSIGHITITTGQGATRGVHLVGLANGNLYHSTTAAGIGATSTASGLVTTGVIAGTDYAGKLYLLDGTSSKIYDVLAGTLTTWVPSKGTLPVGCRVCCTWRGRVVVANQAGSEQNIYMSRSGDPLDFDYNPAVPDALQAVALNASPNAGRVGQPVVALIAHRDDVMNIMCDGSIFAMTGDPAAGGAVTTISDEIGMYSATSWCMDETGIIYFVGTGGFYRMAAGGGIQNLSMEKCPQFFASLDRDSNFVTCSWDTDRHGCWVFVTKHDGSAGQHLWYDARQESFFPQLFPVAMNPACALVVDGSLSVDRQLLIGCIDGYVRSLDNTAANDDGTSIVSFVQLGPFRPFGDFSQVKITEIEAVLGDGQVAYEVHVGADGAAALASAAAYTGTWTVSGRNPKVRQRAKGGSLSVVLKGVAGNIWSVETIQAAVVAAGRQR